ncbi:MAG: hypothetical protein WD061_01885 [Candidatus Saccharimonadales bacterium]
MEEKPILPAIERLEEEVKPGETVGLEPILIPYEIDEWWSAYDERFRELNLNNPCRQSFNYEEFTEAMQDDTVLKFVYRKEGEIVSMCLFGTDLRVFPWISQEYYEAKYPEAFANDNFLYFMAILTKKGNYERSYASELIKYMVKYWKDRDSQDTVVSFDCSEGNNQFLPKLVAGAINNSGVGSVELEHQGSQHYYAGKMEF